MALKPGRSMSRHLIRGALAALLAAALILAVAFLVEGCAGGRGAWTDVDTRRATAIVRTQENALVLCTPNDAGMCRADQVRALDGVALCKAGQMLYAHGQPVNFDAGECPAQ